MAARREKIRHLLLFKLLPKEEGNDDKINSLIISAYNDLMNARPTNMLRFAGVATRCGPSQYIQKHQHLG